MANRRAEPLPTPDENSNQKAGCTTTEPAIMIPRRESGLYYYRARYYDSQTGRFLSEDPIRFGGLDENLYRYVFNNPLNLVDAEGKFAILFPLLGAGAGVGEFFAGAGAAAALLGILSTAGDSSDTGVPNSFEYAEHTKNKRRSTKDKHEAAEARKNKPEKADARRKKPAKDKKKKKKQCK